MASSLSLVEKVRNIVERRDALTDQMLVARENLAVRDIIEAERGLAMEFFYLKDQILEQLQSNL